MAPRQHKCHSFCMRFCIFVSVFRCRKGVVVRRQAASPAIGSTQMRANYGASQERLYEEDHEIHWSIHPFKFNIRLESKCMLLLSYHIIMSHAISPWIQWPNNLFLPVAFLPRWKGAIWLQATTITTTMTTLELESKLERRKHWFKGCRARPTNWANPGKAKIDGYTHAGIRQQSSETTSCLQQASERASNSARATSSLP